MKKVSTLMLCSCPAKLVILASLFFSIQAFAQPIGKAPKFLDGTKPNFFKMQRKAEKHFKQHPVNTANMRVEEDTTGELEVDFGKDYNRKEDNEYTRYKRWEWFWRDRVNEDGSFPDAMGQYETYLQLQSSGSNFRLEEANPTWTDVSMKRNSGGYWGLGRTESVSINPKNPAEFYTTSNGGGVWKTTDGGLSYTAVGDQLPMLQCGKVLVDHQTPTTVYVSLGDDRTSSGGLGVYKSTNGGTSWNPTGLTAVRNNTIAIRYMAMSPTNSQVIIAATNKGLYRTANGGTTWTVVRTGTHYDVIFRPNDGNVVYAAAADIYKSTDAGLTWTKISTFNSTSIRMSTSLSNPNFLGVALLSGDNPFYVSTDQGATYTLKGNMPEGCEMLVSQVNVNNVYCGCVDNFRSTNGGVTWTQFTHWSGQNGLKEIHADNHGMNFDPTKPHEIYVSNDGGVEKFNEQTNTWSYLSNGLAITMYYQIAVAQTHALAMAGGTQDNGGNMRKRDGTWRNTTGGDATMCLMDPSNDLIMYSQYINGGGIARTNNAWSSRTNLDPAITAAGIVEADGDWATPFAIHEANPTVLVAGYKDVIFSSNRGDAWKKISTNLSTSNLREIAISPSNANHIYAAVGSTFYRTFDQGATAWSSMTHPGGGVTSIVVHPTEPKTVYTTNSGGNGRRVYKSIDGGVNWTNLSTGIPNDVSVTSIAYEKGTNEGLYVGTYVGVFYKNTSMTTWIYFGTGLPNAPITDLQISNFAKKIRVGTYGRGIWEANLYTDAVTSVEGSSDKESQVKVYPNPFVDVVKVECQGAIGSIKLFNANGQELEKPAFDANGAVKLGVLSKGVYTLEITNQEGTKWAKKIVKE